MGTTHALASAAQPPCQCFGLDDCAGAQDGMLKGNMVTVRLHVCQQCGGPEDSCTSTLVVGRILTLHCTAGALK